MDTLAEAKNPNHRPPIRAVVGCRLYWRFWVRVHEYPDGTVSVFLGPHRLARFAPDGQQISPDALQPGSVLGAVKDKPLGRASARP